MKKNKILYEQEKQIKNLPIIKCDNNYRILSIQKMKSLGICGYYVMEFEKTMKLF